MVDTKKLFTYEIQGPNDHTYTLWESDVLKLQKAGKLEHIYERFEKMNIVHQRDYDGDKHDGCYIPQEPQAYIRRQVGYDTIFDRPVMTVHGKGYNLLWLQEEFKTIKEEKPEQGVI